VSGPGARRPVKDTTHPDCLLTRGVTLFNHGYYWEAHEAWERLWQAMPRDSAATRLLQDLIVLAAARVKARQGQAIGIAHNAPAPQPPNLTARRLSTLPPRSGQRRPARRQGRSLKSSYLARGPIR